MKIGPDDCHLAEHNRADCACNSRFRRHVNETLAVVGRVGSLDWCLTL